MAYEKGYRAAKDKIKEKIEKRSFTYKIGGEEYQVIDVEELDL